MSYCNHRLDEPTAWTTSRRLLRARQVEAGDVARVDGLDEELDALAREAVGGEAQVGDEGLAQLLGRDVLRRDAREAVDLLAAERLRVLDGLATPS